MRPSVVLVVVVAAVGGCAFKGEGNPADDQGDDVADDTGDDTGIDADPADPDAAPGTPDAARPDAFNPPDPVTTTFGERPTSAHTGVALDTYLDQLQPLTVFETNINMLIDGDLGSSVPATGMLRFELAAIPAGSTISAVALDVHTTGVGAGDPMELFVVNQPWNAAATWESSGIEPWFTAGAGPPSRAEVVVGSIGTSADNTGYTMEIPATVVQGWVDSPATNHGFALVVGGGDEVYLRASNSTIVEDRPQLTVTYVPPS